MNFFKAGMSSPGSYFYKDRKELTFPEYEIIEAQHTG